MLVVIFGLLGLIPMFDGMHEATTASRMKGGPIVLYVSRENCTFCLRFEKDVLAPILNSGDYETAVFREIVLDDDSDKPDVHFEHVDMNIVGTPTIIFLDASGREISERIVGYSDNEFAFYRFERRLKSAIRKIVTQP